MIYTYSLFYSSLHMYLFRFIFRLVLSLPVYSFLSVPHISYFSNYYLIVGFLYDARLNCYYSWISIYDATKSLDCSLKNFSYIFFTCFNCFFWICAYSTFDIMSVSANYVIIHMARIFNIKPVVNVILPMFHASKFFFVVYICIVHFIFLFVALIAFPINSIFKISC